MGSPSLILETGVSKRACVRGINHGTGMVHIPGFCFYDGRKNHGEDLV
jgi:hypothetical protein